MKKAILFTLIVLCVAGNCCADTVKGTIEKVVIKEYYIIVNGNKVDVSKATIFTENDMNVVKKCHHKGPEGPQGREGRLLRVGE